MHAAFDQQSSLTLRDHLQKKEQYSFSVHSDLCLFLATQGPINASVVSVFCVM